MSLRENDLSTALGIDGALTAIEQELEVLLNISPINAAEAWVDFESSGFSNEPLLRTRPLGFEPDLVRRRVYNLEIEKVDDPALANLLNDKRDEIGRQITLLEDRDTTRFIHGSQQVFGDVGESLVADAREVLEMIPVVVPEGPRVTASGFCEAAEEELDLYRTRYPGFSAELEVRSDISDLMVFHGRLFIPENATFRRDRVDPLIQHEVGTHVVTYENGLKQPLKLLTVGLPRYDETQEGLAVLAEFVSGGLDLQRLRLLAGRVIAVDRLLQGADFLEIFEELTERHSFPPRVAFGVATRVARSGGLTKDVIYLRGISRVLEFAFERKTLEPLLVGKLSLDHVPLVEDLMEREILHPPWIRPHWMEGAEQEKRLALVFDGLSIRNLVEEVMAS